MKKETKKMNTITGLNKMVHVCVQKFIDMYKEIYPEGKLDDIKLTINRKSLRSVSSIEVCFYMEDGNSLKNKDIYLNNPSLEKLINVEFSNIVSEAATLKQKVKSLNVEPWNVFSVLANKSIKGDEKLFTAEGLEWCFFEKLVKKAETLDLIDFIPLIDGTHAPKLKKLAEKYNQTGNSKQSAKSYYGKNAGPFFKDVQSPEIVNNFFGKMVETASLINGKSKDENTYYMLEIFEVLDELKDDIPNVVKNDLLVNAFLSSSDIKNIQVWDFAEKFIGEKNITNPKLLEVKEKISSEKDEKLLSETDLSNLVFLNPNLAKFANMKYAISFGAGSKVNVVKKEDVYDLIIMATNLLKNAGLQEEMGIIDISKAKLPKIGSTLAISVNEKFDLNKYQEMIAEVLPVVLEDTLKGNPIGTFISYANNENAISLVKIFRNKKAVESVFNNASLNEDDNNDSYSNPFKI